MTLLKSNAPPGVFGVLEAPKDANAPDPRPNALEAPVVGEAREVVEGDMALKGFLLLCDEVSPFLRPNVYFGVGLSVEGSAPFVDGAPVDKESLLLFERRVHRLSIRRRYDDEGFIVGAPKLLRMELLETW